MSLSTRFTQVVLLGLAAVAGYQFYTVLVSQQLKPDIEAFMRKEILPDTTISVAGVKYTGIRALDDVLNFLNYLFWTVLHDTDYVRKTRSEMFIGSFTSGYTLLLLETERPGNRGRIISSMLFWGLLTQVIGWGAVMTTWMAIAVGGAYIANPRPSQIVPESKAGRAIPWAILIGYFIPGVLGYLPSPSVWTPIQKLYAMASWQVFPIWVSIAHQVFQNVFADYHVEAGPRQASGRKLPVALRTPYTFILGVAGIVRVGVIAKVLYETKATTLGVVPAWSVFKQVLVPHLLDPSIRYEVIAEGAAAFLEWDETIGQTALVIYAAFQCFRAWTPKSSSDFAFIILGIPLTWLIFGSSGVAVAFLATRDDFVLRENEKTKKLKQ